MFNELKIYLVSLNSQFDLDGTEETAKKLCTEVINVKQLIALCNTDEVGKFFEAHIAIGFYNGQQVFIQDEIEEMVDMVDEVLSE